MHDDRDRKGDEEYIGDDVGDAHGEQLRVALSALRSWIRYDLPVVGSGVALCQCGNEDHEESNDEKDAYTTQSPVVPFLPETFCQTLQELGNGELGHPDAGMGLVAL